MALFRMKPQYRKKAKVLSSYGLAPSLQSISANLVGISFSDYAIFAGGCDGYSDINFVNVYNNSLTRTLVHGLDQGVREFAATVVGNNVLFAGGYGGWNYWDLVNVYDSSFTFSRAENLVCPRYNLSATTVGNYALFGGGTGNTSNYVYDGRNSGKLLDVYDISLTHSYSMAFQDSFHMAGATTIGNYALFGGGANTQSNNATYTVRVINNSLTYSTTSNNLSYVRYYLTAATLKDYALFMCGNCGGSDTQYIYNANRAVDAFNSSLTKFNVESAYVYKGPTSTVLDDYVLLTGNEDNKSITTYNKSLSKIYFPIQMTLNKYALAAATVGNYALFAGGCGYNNGSSGYYDTVDVIQAA